MKKTKKKSPAKKKPHPLPATFAGADVLGGKAMDADDLDELLEEHALDEFITAPEGVYLVVDDNALQLGRAMQPTLFLDRDKAIRCAQARSNGNVDHRVLKVTEQVLIVGTDNELPG